MEREGNGRDEVEEEEEEDKPNGKASLGVEAPREYDRGWMIQKRGTRESRE